MGVSFSTLFGRSKDLSLLMLGLDEAGKKTILDRLMPNQPASDTVPTIGLNVRTATHNNIRYNLWDVGGKNTILPMWKHYYTGTQGLIFVVDSQDRERMGEAKQKLYRMLDEGELKHCALLVLANNQDSPEAMSPGEVAAKLDLHQTSDRSWYVHPSCSTTGVGLLEGLEWLFQNVKKR